MNRSYRILLFFALLVSMFAVTACSTKKNTFVTRTYHNLTSRYNGYYYAGEIIKENKQRMEKAHIDDYSAILPMFIYADNKSAKNYYQDMDKAIQKTSLVIKRHTIVDKKNVEIPGAVRWIDDNYLVLGKARFYKREFFDALVAFEYVAKTYKKDDNRFMAILWMIRTHNELLTLSQSGPLIDKLKSDKEFPKKFQQELSSLTADYYIKRGDNENAIKELTKAITLTRNKKVRARFTFILAQLYEQTGDTKKASQLYSQVIKLKPAYEMVFNARMKSASLYDVTAGSSKEIKRQLLRMVKDDKNIEYLDQIYYSLAQIEEKEKNIYGKNGAVDYLKLSVRHSTVNIKQKGISYLRLADLSFDAADYKAAQAYYDSTITVLPKEYPNYEVISAKKKNLTGLVQNLNTIAFEDSVQRLAKDSVLRERTIAAIIQKVEEDEKKVQDEKSNPNGNFNNQTLPNNNQQAASSFTIYNPALASFHYSEFIKRWGSRTLEDNWRRSTKSQDMERIEDDENPSVNPGPIDTLSRPIVNDKKKKEYYLQNIPFTVQDMEKSTAKIIDAYYNAGVIYKEQLLNNEKSAETFEELQRRFKENKYKLSTYYQLYRLYSVMGNQQKSDYYKNLLVNDYPESEFARLIKNPDYAQQTLASQSEVETAYSTVLTAYTEGRYTDVITGTEAAAKQYPKNFLMPKFDFVKALAVGKTQGLEPYKKSLQEIVVKYPKDPVKPKAEEILAILAKAGAPDTTSSGLDSVSAKPKSPYNFKPDSEHFVVLVVNSKKVNINTLKTRLSNFNAEFYSTAVFNIAQIGFAGDNQLITIKTFADADKAIDYFTFLRSDQEVFTGITPDNFKLFAISSANFTIFYKEKNVPAYLEFFNEMYPTEKE